MEITALVAMTKDRVIGRDGGLPWHYPEDLKRFKHLTLGSTVIMGRKTWESIGCKPLPQRRNIVISRNPVANAECYTSVAQALAVCDSPIWIIGGGEIYTASLDVCTAIDVTWVPDHIEGETLVRFPELDTHVWQAGQIIADEFDARLGHQLFTRKRC